MCSLTILLLFFVMETTFASCLLNELGSEIPSRLLEKRLSRGLSVVQNAGIPTNVNGTTKDPIWSSLLDLSQCAVRHAKRCNSSCDRKKAMMTLSQNNNNIGWRSCDAIENFVYKQNLPCCPKCLAEFKSSVRVIAVEAWNVTQCSEKTERDSPSDGDLKDNPILEQCHLLLERTRLSSDPTEAQVQETVGCVAESFRSLVAQTASRKPTPTTTSAGSENGATVANSCVVVLLCAGFFASVSLYTFSRCINYRKPKVHPTVDNRPEQGMQDISVHLDHALDVA